MPEEFQHRPRRESHGESSGGPDEGKEASETNAGSPDSDGQPQLSDQELEKKFAEQRLRADARVADEEQDYQDTTEPELAALEAEFAAFDSELETADDEGAGAGSASDKLREVSTDRGYAGSAATAMDDAASHEMADLEAELSEMEVGSTASDATSHETAPEIGPEPKAATADVANEDELLGMAGGVAADPTPEEASGESANERLRAFVQRGGQQQVGEIAVNSVGRDATRSEIKKSAAIEGDKFNEEAKERRVKEWQGIVASEGQQAKEGIEESFRENGVTDGLNEAQLEELQEQQRAITNDDMRQDIATIKRIEGIQDEAVQNEAMSRFRRQVATTYYGGNEKAAAAHVEAMQREGVQDSVKQVTDHEIAIEIAEKVGIDKADEYLAKKDNPDEARAHLESLADEGLRDHTLSMFDEAHAETIPLSEAESRALLEQLDKVDELPLPPENKLKITEQLLRVDPQQLTHVEDLQVMDDYVILSFTNTTGEVRLDPTGQQQPLFTGNIRLPDLSTASLTFADTVHEAAASIPLLGQLKNAGRLQQGYRILSAVGYEMPPNEPVSKEGKSVNKRLLSKLKLDEGDSRLRLEQAGIYSGDGFNYGGARELHRHIVAETGRRGENLDYLSYEDLVPTTATNEEAT